LRSTTYFRPYRPTGKQSQILVFRTSCISPVLKKQSAISTQHSAVSSKRLEGECYPSAHYPAYRST
uniref:hypothetical protein n=1 Tax=Okeania sp. SIO2F4 TaxID=2607790 RepID=UPI0025EAA197